MSFLWIIPAGFVIAVLYVLLEIRKIGTPTKGPVIERATRPGTALVVIDMQSDFTALPVWEAAQLNTAMENIRTAVDAARRTGMPVIAVRQVYKAGLARLLNGWFNQGRGNAGSPGIGLDPRLGLAPDVEVEKSMGDAFSEPAFVRYLEENRIGTLILTGLDGCHCVKNTAFGALNRGYAVRIDPKAVLAANDAGWSKMKRNLTAAGAEMGATAA
ncbi:cysteine hydrolase [Ruegeria pomeroyi]|uniref:Isochorismatase family protein n=2 Tax=Ruegeria pomeroyi TaxID=89184 RepID=Q5LMI3_RUEPO|nr:cysteine hydrolase [Ruegeria pomeroyi]HCE70737.1 cysteine hydrolase [Ruegeria sp.]AAV96805.1 isochorismatase family protein [Ruegeria pomeroyi DSS-3]NVK96348.1 cysteine hydrolase [Ruegeria pomeroyi]NVK99687.1 cysteine hydrolase [Ruegeria pomeroyi]QWV10336.1 cysteine hydrolase [Ruegeria pomeroyi]